MRISGYLVLLEECQSRVESAIILLADDRVLGGGPGGEAMSNTWIRSHDGFNVFLFRPSPQVLRKGLWYHVILFGQTNVHGSFNVFDVILDDKTLRSERSAACSGYGVANLPDETKQQLSDVSSPYGKRVFRQSSTQLPGSGSLAAQNELKPQAHREAPQPDHGDAESATL